MGFTGSSMRAMALFARAASSVVICSKSSDLSFSSCEKVRVASISISSRSSSGGGGGGASEP